MGFGTGSGWLPQPPSWAQLAVSAQEEDRESMLWLYRDALRLRRQIPALGTGTGTALRWLDLGDEVLAFSRDPGFVCVVNTGSAPVGLPEGTIVLASLRLDAAATDTTRTRTLAADAAVWLVTP